MEPVIKRKSQGMADTFASTANTVYKIITIVFLAANYFAVSSASKSTGNELNLPIFLAAALGQIIMILIIEPLTYEKFPAINFSVYALVGLSSGLLLYSYKSNIAIAVLFTNVVMIGLRLPMKRGIILSAYYYVIYILSTVYGRNADINLVLFDIHILVLFLSIVYLCHYFSCIEREKIKQDEAIVELIDEKVNLTTRLSSKNEELEKTYWDMVETLIGVIETRDNFTGGHSVKVCEYSVKLAQKLGYDEDKVANIMKASILHDIGKMGIPDNILLKPGALSSEEYNTIMNHPEIGCRILTKVKGLEDVLPMILYHHERIDGTGYPFGLEGDKIPDGAKIIAIADSYDAMTSNRPYRKALVKKEAKKRLLEGAGTQFDAELVCKFIEIIENDNVADIRNYRYIENIKKNTNIV